MASERSPSYRFAKQLAWLSVVASGLLALLNIGLGLRAGSTAVVALGAEFAGDVMASLVVLAGIITAARPPDENHPYGHGRFEMLSGFLVGLALAGAGVAICFKSLSGISEFHPPPSSFGLWPAAAAMVVKSTLAYLKFRHGKRIHSSALMADAWNDSVDVLSSANVIIALSLTVANPSRFLVADHYGGFVVGIIVIITAILVVRDRTVELIDTMPDAAMIEAIREVAQSAPSVRGVEKCFARKTGLQYHVDLHLEVDPEITVREGHDIASAARDRLKERLDWVADVLVHIEPTMNESTELKGKPPAGRS